MTLRILSVLAVAALALAGSAVPASADPVSPGKIHLKVNLEGPVFGDDNDLIYNAHVSNQGPAAATGVIVHVTGWFCKASIWSASSCRVLPDRKDPTKFLSYDVPLDALTAGGKDSFPVETYLPDEETGSVRTTMEVVKSDQEDSASVPGTCREGLNPQDDCDSTIASIQ